MTLWILYRTAYADDGIAGIYTTREKAEEAHAKMKQNWVTQFTANECIEQIEADVEPED